MTGVVVDLERLEKCRKKLGITKQEMAKRLEVAQPTYLRYESGQRKPSIHTVRAMAKLFGTSEDYLLGKRKTLRADYITINSKESPKLYKLLVECKKMDDKQLARLIEFSKKMK